MDDKYKVTAELNEFYSGLEAGLKSFQDIRSIYDEQIAFDFNSLSNFFHPNENKISEILTFFLNPHGNHGQKDVFLQIFINKMELNLKCSESTRVKACTEYHTNEHCDLSQ